MSSKSPYVLNQQHQGYHKIFHRSCINCKHCEQKQIVIAQKSKNRAAIKAHLRPLCGVGKFHVTPNGCCDLFEYNPKREMSAETETQDIQ
jgi:hypothetical protein